MNSRPDELPDVSTYIAIIDRFLEHSTSAGEFESAYLQAIKAERRIKMLTHMSYSRN